MAQNLDDSLFEDVPYQEPDQLDDSLFEDIPFEDLPGPEEVKEPEMGKAQAAIAKFAQGAGFGLSDELAGSVEAAGEVVGLEGLGGDLRKVGLSEGGPTLKLQRILDAYTRGRDTERGVLQKAEVDQPGISGTSDFVGGLMAPIPFVGPAGKALSKIPGAKQAPGAILDALKSGGKAALGTAQKALPGFTAKALPSAAKALPGAAAKALPGAVPKALPGAGAKIGTEAAAKGAAEGFVPTAMSAAKTGAMAGGLEGLGRSEDGTITGTALDTLLGAGLGGALGYGIGRVGDKFSKASLEKVAKEAPIDANKAALKSIGAKKKDFVEELGTKTNKKATKDTAKGTGQTLLDESLLKMKQSAAEVKQAIVTKMNEVVQNRMIPTIQKLDQQSSKLNENQLVEPLDNFINSTRKSMEDMTGSTTYADEASSAVFDNMVNTSKRVYDDVISALQSDNKFNALLKIKQKLQKEANFSDPSKSSYNEFLIAQQANVSKLMNDLSRKVNPDLGIKMAKNNKTYSDLIRANAIAGSELAASEAASSKIGVGEYIAAGVIGNITNNRLLGPLAVAGKRGIEKVTGKDTSKMFNTLEAFQKNKSAKSARKALAKIDDSPFKKAMQGQSGTIAAAATVGGAAILDKTDATEPYQKDKKVTDYIKTASPEYLAQSAATIRSKHGKSGEKLASTLEKIAERDRQSRDALIFSLMQDPNNRKMLGLVEEE